MKRFVWVAIGVGLLLAGTLTWALWSPAPTEEPAREEKVRQPQAVKHQKNSAKRKVRRPRPAAARKSQGKSMAKRQPNAQRERSVAAKDAETEKLSEADQRVVNELQSALDEEKLADVRKLAAQAVNNPSPTVRLRALEAVQWFGVKTLPEAAAYLADGNADVRELAMETIEQALAEIDNDAEKVRYIESLMSVNGACTPDGIAMLSGELTGLDSTMAAEAAARIIKANPNDEAVKAMKEVYEFATGEQYTNEADADAWLAANRAEAEDADEAAERQK